MVARSFVFAMIALLGMTACRQWFPIALPSPGRNLEGNPQQVQLTHRVRCSPQAAISCKEELAVVTLSNPRIESDSLIGYREEQPGTRVALAVADITNAAAMRVDKVRTAGWMVAGTITTAVVVGVVALFALLSAMK